MKEKVVIYFRLDQSEN